MKYFTSESWVKSALDLLGGKGEIGQFRYTPLIGPDILSGILTNVTGQSALGFAYKNLVGAIASLFKPIAMDRIDLIKKYIEPIFEEV